MSDVNALMILRLAESRRNTMIGIGLFILLVIVIVLVVIYFNAPPVPKIPSRDENIQSLVTRRDTIYSNVVTGGEAFGLTPEDVAIILPALGTTCVVFPENGVCDERYYDLKDGCCEIRDNASAEAKAAYNKAIKQLCLEIGVGILADQILTNILPRIIKGELGGVYAQKLKTFIDDGVRLGARFAPKLASLIRAVSQTIMMRMMVRGVSKVMIMMAKLGSGPVGWALLVLDIFTILADIGDQENYDSWVENKMYLRMRNQIVYKVYEELKKGGSDLPMLFPIDRVFPVEMEGAQSTMLSVILPDMIVELIKSPEGVDIFIKLLVDGSEDNELVLTPAEDALIDASMTTVRDNDPKKMDALLYDNLLVSLPEERRGDIMLVESMSSSNTIGISLTRAAADAWNEENKEAWFLYNDLFFPPNKPEDYSEPFVAVFTNKYLTIGDDPGTRDNPNVVYKDLPEEVALMYPFGMLVATCEKPRTSAQYKTPIDPKEFGVSFDFTKGVCDFTPGYCQRYGLVTKNKDMGDTSYVDCVKRPGQAAAEVVLGPTMTRGTIKVWEDRIDGLKSKDPAKVVETLAIMAVDPSGGFSVLGNMAVSTGENRVDKYGLGGAIGLGLVDPFGIYENFGQNIAEQVKGRDKYCLPGDTCKFFHAKHAGGNFMNWSARDKDGEIYSNGQGFQNQVKVSEDHTFYVPQDGTFKVGCQPGDERDFTYDEIPTDKALSVSCWAGKLRVGDAPLITRESRLASKSPCPPGWRDDGTVCSREGYDRTIGSQPVGCKEGDSRDGPVGLCYKACKPGYKREGVECAETCPPGTSATLLHCTDWTPNSAFFLWEHRNRCYEKYDGTGEVSRAASTCNRPCKPGFTRRSHLLGTAFCNTSRDRYPVAGTYVGNECPSDMDKVGLICYPKCPDDYNATLSMCHPKGGLKRIELSERLSCPDGWDNIVGVCWKRCPDGYDTVGATCVKK